MKDKPKASIKLIFLSLFSIVLTVLTAEGAKSFKIFNETDEDIYFNAKIEYTSAFEGTCGAAPKQPNNVYLQKRTGELPLKWHCYTPTAITFKLPDTPSYGNTLKLTSDLTVDYKLSEKVTIQVKIQINPPDYAKGSIGTITLRNLPKK